MNNVALKEFAFQYDYRQKGALINLRQGAKLVNTFSNTTLFEMTNPNETLCIFIPRMQNVSIVSRTDSVNLFPNVRIFSFNDEPILRSIHPRTMPKLSLPKRNVTKIVIPTVPSTLKPIEINYAFIFGLTIPVSIAFVALTVIFCALICSKCYEIDGRKMFGA